MLGKRSLGYLQRGDARKKSCARARSAQAFSRARAQRARARTDFQVARARSAQNFLRARAQNNFFSWENKSVNLQFYTRK